MEQQDITYEQPITELTRVCLRIEHCLQQLYQFIDLDSVWAARLSVAAIIEILAILDRPDLKMKLTAELQRIHENFSKFSDTTKIDLLVLNNLLEQLSNLKQTLNDINGKFGQPLRENKFIEHIRQNMDAQTSPYSFNTPLYHYWLQQPFASRQQLLQAWLSILAPIESTVTLLLKLIRQSSTFHTASASEGFYEQTLQANHAWQLIRVRLNTNLHCFPQISVGRHRLCISYKQPDFTLSLTDYKQDVDFAVACCAV